MTWFMVDVECDGPIPGDYSMVSLGAVIVEPALSRTFYATFRPVTEKFVPEALKVCGFTREQTLAFDDPAASIAKFGEWVKANNKGRAQFVSDNNGFDWQFVNWYFHHFLGANPFGFSSTNLGSLYKGLTKDVFVNFKHLRKTAHTHYPVDDAKGNAEALLAMKEQFGLKIGWE
ncbi:MAG: exonuclease [Planctomycetota bacterium]